MAEFVPFRFRVHLYQSDNNHLLCSGSFSEVTGFELTMEPKTLAEGGRNWGELQRIGVTKFAPMVLKRGVTSVNDLWSWFDATTRGANYGYRLHGEIEVLGNPTLNQGNNAESGQVQTEEQVVMTWRLHGVLPTKFKGPDLNSTANQVAIEEVHLVHEGLELQRTAPAQSNDNSSGGQPT
ncbi:phage tail protein [Hahella sp. CCB-MM4]|uniref:phage tail protein n=1 Tax=Hahella sp. (strain CCB-MM4) TaxID=1926491 RepID=UPI000B9AB167|nr:phage tail protein [Hahella sp. CCB-MM4]OZG70333.1 phage tail protein [Hahella sp. CCB-MM4]